MGEHVLEGFHVLSSVANELGLWKTGDVNLYIPLIVAFQKLLMKLVCFLEFVLGLVI